MENIFLIDASHLLLLSSSKYFNFILKFIENMDIDNIDNLYYDLISEIDDVYLKEFTNIATRVLYYISYLIYSKRFDVCSFKVIKSYISKEKIMLKVEIKEL